jgi:hypothetical protein
MAILRLRTLVLVTALMALLPARPAAQAGPSVENDIKAAFLYNFAKYVEWPRSAFPSPEFHLCVLADAAFEKSIEDLIAGETIAGRRVKREAPATLEAARACHILFIGRTEMGRAGELLAALKGSHVFTVGDTPDFLALGGVVTFVREGDRVRFDVSLGEAHRAGLTISSRLLRVARTVAPGGPG